jgi:hypothetical protein
MELLQIEIRTRENENTPSRVITTSKADKRKDAIADENSTNPNPNPEKKKLHRTKKTMPGSSQEM